MAATYVFGEILGNPVGTTYADRPAAMAAGVHQVNMQGISGNRTVGANSIVVNGGYEDDLDLGDEIIYTGAGGNDTATKKQIDHQTFTQVGNAALIISEENGLPVRVIRGSRGDRAHSPATGLRYDGLFRVDSHWNEPGRSGFNVCRFRLVKLTAAEAAAWQSNPAVSGATTAGRGPAQAGNGAGGGFDPRNPPSGDTLPGREVGVAVRVVRDTAVSTWVKRLYEYACQICDTVLDLPVGDYAEGAHIRALGKPHAGPDTVNNVLCLCPTHHLLFDKGALYISDTFQVLDHHGNQIGPLTRQAGHGLDIGHIKYHRQTAGF